MSFITDQQTLNDLSIFSKSGKPSIYAFFNQTHTTGGAELLEQMFRAPLSNREDINRRSAIFRHFQQLKPQLPFLPEWFDAAQQYLGNSDERTRLTHEDNTLKRKFSTLIGSDTSYQFVLAGVNAVANIVTAIYAFVHSNTLKGNEDLEKESAAVMQRMDHPAFAEVLSLSAEKKRSFEQTAMLDRLFRFTMRDTILKIVGYCYAIDVYHCVANVASKMELAFAEAAAGNTQLVMKKAYHPLVEKAVGNDFELMPGQQVVFLTGANMAGKSTFMKTLGICVYLAHMGFPVPATSMRFAVRDGIFTTINLADNLNMGHSHFYAEVLRVKNIVEQVKQGHNLFVIFDELFRGTNVKDAGDGTVAITHAFAQQHQSLFVVSTHIIEAADELKKRCDNIRYVYMPTYMEGSVPRYTYTLEEGVTGDRHGMLIINNEGMLDMLSNATAQNAAGEQSVFQTDKQTLDDLNILGKYKQNSIFSLFNATKTRDGERLLDQLFTFPLTDAKTINERSALYGFFSRQELQFPVSAAQFIKMEEFVKDRPFDSALQLTLRGTRRQALSLLGVKKEMELAAEGLFGTLTVFDAVRNFLQAPWAKDAPPVIGAMVEEALLILSDPMLKSSNIGKKADAVSWKLLLKYEVLLFNKMNRSISRLLGILYELDVYISVGNTAKRIGLSFATAIAEGGELSMKNAFHPAIPNAKGNDISFTQQRNFMFLTGANMAGKSTIMKTTGVCVYLAHMGFPVPARDMRFTPMEGIYTSINVADNLNMGYSHFYAEVLRVKHIATQVAAQKRLFVMFDELFKGTNVKDAYDATLAFSQAFHAFNRCIFIISTHIVEVGVALGESHTTTQFKYMPTVMDGNTPVYTYSIANGISDDRHGMVIIRQEGILDMLSAIAEKKIIHS
ncbi:MAG: MutS-related protein [Pseudobacter sp.]|uniref:MutS-related protein n=1 Tax=Pseudobacter sp. TaxID=2045420 RepID=UPI003F7D798F